MNIFNRKTYNKLLEWKEKYRDNALLLEGARRIGKSTIVEEFAKKEYKSYLLINFDDFTDTVRNAFENKLVNLDDFYNTLMIEYHVTLYKKESLIIFDEVQKYPKARQSLKKLVADGRYDYIETGSLISINENVADITIPSEEMTLKMYPMDFEEFLMALGEKDLIDYIKECFQKLVPLADPIHKKAFEYFTKYLLIGGMPQVVSDYIEDKSNFDKCDMRKRMILDLYRKDIMKIKGAYRNKVLSVFDQIPSYLSKHEKRVRFSSIVGGMNTENSYENTFMWLDNSMICNNCFKCNDPNIGFNLTKEDTEFAEVKCYMGDTGLLFSAAFDDNEIKRDNLYNQILHSKLNINKGMLYENLISQMLVSNGNSLYFYNKYSEKKHRNDIEIDFLISKSSSINSKIIPIEVKSGKEYTYDSLKRFIEIYKKRIDKSYIVHPKNLSFKENIICIPCYMAWCI